MSADTDRRGFLKNAALTLTSVTVAGAAAAAERGGTPKMRAQRRMQPSARVVLTRSNLGKLSNSLFDSPAERAAFMKDPNGYTKGKLQVGSLTAFDQQKLGDMRDQFADGLCCGGCGC